MFLLVLCIKFCIIAVIFTMLGFLLGMGYLVLGGVNLGDGSCKGLYVLLSNLPALHVQGKFVNKNKFVSTGPLHRQLF